MATARLLLGVLPVATAVCASYGLRPRFDVVAPVRLAIIRGAVATGAVAVAGVELLSAARRIDAGSDITFWVIVTLVASAGAALRRWSDNGRRGAATSVPDASHPDASNPDASNPDSPKSPGSPGRPRWTKPQHTLLIAIGVLLLAELVLAIAAAPNNYDSNYYHLPKVENWVSRHSVEVYPTLLLPQVVLAPGGEYLLLHLRLLTGGDALFNLVQYSAGLGVALAGSRTAAQLGASRTGQLFTAAVFASAPMVVLESTSTQTDLVVSAWLVCAASLALDSADRRPRTADLVALGAAAGLTAVTKSTGLMGLAAILAAWGLAQFRPEAPSGAASPRSRAALVRPAAAGLAVIAVSLTVVGPFFARMDRVFGEPLGPAQHRQGLSMQRHDPAAILVNALRITASTLVIPVPPVNRGVAGAVVDLSLAVGVDPQDPDITLATGTYPDSRWWPDEDHSPYPIQSALMLVSVLAVLVGRRIAGRVRVAGGVVLVALVLTAATVKWQPWGNRLMLPALGLGAPMAGWWLDRLLHNARGRWRQLSACAIAVVMALSLVSAYGSVLLGWPRRLIGHDSVFVLDDWQERFVRQPQLAEDYRLAARAVRGSGARRIGVVTRGDQWEYPWWLLLPERQLVSLESAVPGRPPATPAGVDAIVCASPPEVCRGYVPEGWTYQQVGPSIAVAVRQ